jgi:hypothetical protein
MAEAAGYREGHLALVTVGRATADPRDAVVSVGEVVAHRPPAVSARRTLRRRDQTASAQRFLKADLGDAE